MSTEDPEDRPGRTLLVALTAMAGAALLVGLVVGGVVVGGLRYSGASDVEVAAGDGPVTSLYIPEYSPTPKASDDLGLPTANASDSPDISLPSPTGEPSVAADRITLFVAPQSVAPGERINLNGVYPGGEGASLQVQRREGGTWVDFPVTATVRGGSFETWIMTSRAGRSPFRMYDAASGRRSNVAVVQIG